MEPEEVQRDSEEEIMPFWLSERGLRVVENSSSMLSKEEVTGAFNSSFVLNCGLSASSLVRMMLEVEMEEERVIAGLPEPVVKDIISQVVAGSAEEDEQLVEGSPIWMFVNLGISSRELEKMTMERRSATKRAWLSFGIFGVVRPRSLLSLLEVR